MKRILFIFGLSALIIAVFFTRIKANRLVPTPVNSAANNENIVTQPGSVPGNAVTDNQANPAIGFQSPLSRAAERVTKKPFGIFITPRNSPVQPERFSGYHTGADFEVFPEEIDKDVPVYAITSGKIIEKRWASGYGGVLIESGILENSPVTIIYGHLNLANINKKTGDNLSAGEQIGILGKNKSPETDGERKHLHLGIHKGLAVDIKGYVNTKSELNNWIDPLTIL